MAQRESFTFYQSFRESAEGLDGLARLDFLEAVISYALEGQEPKFTDKVAKALFAGIRPNLEKGWKQYENGRKGGAPEGNTNAQKTTQKQPKNNPRACEQVQVQLQEQVQVQETNTNSNTHSASEIPPAREVVISFFVGELEKSSQDAEKFCDYYDSCGWCVGKGKKMKNWQAAARGWVRREKEFSARSGGVSVAIPEDDHETENDLFSR